MLASELQSQITNTPPDRHPTDAELALDAFLNIVTHDNVKFDATLSYYAQAGCDTPNDSGTAVLRGGRIWPLWNTEAFENKGVRIGAGIDIILIAIAQHETPITNGAVYETPATSAVGDDYSAVTITYTTDIDDHGYLQGFTMHWHWTPIDPLDSFCTVQVTGENFRYSTGMVRASVESIPDALKQDQFGPPQGEQPPS